MKILTSDIVVALCALFGAINGALGIYFAYRAIQLTTELETLKMRPYIAARYEFTNDPFISITNHGQFAAKIEKITVRSFGSEFEISGDYDEESFDEMFGLSKLVRTFGETGLATAFVQNGTYIGPSEEIKLLFIHPQLSPSEGYRTGAKDLLKQLISKSDISIEYCSIDQKSCDTLVF